MQPSVQDQPIGFRMTSGPEGPVSVGGQFLLHVCVARRDGDEGPVRLLGLGWPGNTVRVDANLFPYGRSLQPGEAVTLALPVMPLESGLLRADGFTIITDGPVEQVHLAGADIPIGVGIGQEVDVTLERICRYENQQCTRVQVHLTHIGQTPFQDFEAHVGPTENVVNGLRNVTRSQFWPGDSLSFAMLVGAEQVEVTLNAYDEGGSRVSHLQELVVPEAEGEAITPYAFLRPPRRVLDNRPELRRIGSNQVPTPVEPNDAGVFRLQGNRRYELTIRPEGQNARHVRITDRPPQVDVSAPQHDANRSAWTFALTVRRNDLWSEPAAIEYVVEDDGAGSRGTVRVKLTPPRFRRPLLALAIGLAVTVEGLNALRKVLLDPDELWADLFGEDGFWSTWEFWRLWSIPIVYCGLLLADWIQYRRRR